MKSVSGFWVWSLAIAERSRKVSVRVGVKKLRCNHFKDLPSELWAFLGMFPDAGVRGDLFGDMRCGACLAHIAKVRDIRVVEEIDITKRPAWFEWEVYVAVKNLIIRVADFTSFSA